ncbi:MAG: y domain 1 [Rariglobus sp.]|nr:y domain 1 [Rariglobus sp.]
MKTLTTILLAVLLCGSAFAESRVWTSTNGSKVEAELVGQTATHVQLKRDLDDLILDVPIASLSDRDRDFIAAQKSKTKPVGSESVESKPARPSAPKEPVFPDTKVWIANTYYLPVGDHPTHRQLLAYYVSGDKEGRAVLKTYQASAKLTAATLAGLQQMANDATKAGDPRARTYTRAVEKLTQQFQETGMRSDAQSAVADVLKALDQEK